ncbi:MAG: hypothetical protein R3C56_23425 [Pirellulaceae bacterium]
MGWTSCLVSEPAVGEKLLSAGGPTSTSMQVPATFSAVALGIQPQPIEVRLWTEDYFPDRPRSYTPPHVLFVLTAEEHAIWITSQLSKWHRVACWMFATRSYNCTQQISAYARCRRRNWPMKKCATSYASRLPWKAPTRGAWQPFLELVKALRQAARNPEIE